MAQVYANESQDRFFAIPEDADLPTGPLVLRSLSGARLDVDPAAVAAYEISEDEAKQLVKVELGAFARKAASTLSSIGSVLRSVGEHRPVEPRAPSKAPDIVAETLGVSPEQLRSDPDAVSAGFETFLGGIMETVKDALKDTPEAREHTRERLSAFVSAMGDDAPDPADLERAFEALRGALGKPELEQRIRSASKKLEEATLRIRQEGQALLDELDEEE